MKSYLITAAIMSTLCLHGSSLADNNKLPIEFSGLIEIEAYQGRPYEGDSVSDIVIATAELGANGNVNDQISAAITLLYEEDSTDLEVDVATLTFQPTDSNWSVSLGQFYVPFGAYETNMVSDPLTLDIGEARETAAVVDVNSANLTAAFYLFNGTNKKNNGADDKVDNFGFNIAYATEGEISFTGSIGYINDIGDSDGIEGGLTTTNVQDHVAGITLTAMFEMGDFNIIGEYIEARHSFQTTELAFDGNGAKPRASNLEAGYNFNLAGMPASIGLGYQTTDEALALELPEKRIIAALALAILKNTTLGLEVTRDSDYNVAEGGTGQSAHTFTLQLAVEL